MHPNELFQGNDGRWYTYFPGTPTRIKRSRKTEQELKEVVIEYWRGKVENPTVREVYEEWITQKLDREDISITTKKRYDRQYKQCMTEFGQRKIKSIEAYDVEDFLLDARHDFDLTAKGFAGLKTLINGIFKYAKKKKWVFFSITEVISDMDCPRRGFRKNRKTENELVFTKEETDKIMDYFYSEELSIVDLGLVLLFYTGLRPGELAGLKKVDIVDNILHIQRTEIRYEDENGKYVYEVIDTPKTEAGIRSVAIPENSMWILEQIEEKNPDGEYLFEKDGKRIKTCSFDKRLRTLCHKLEITEKSPNKIRKTYATELIDSGVDDSIIIAQMGHTDILTTMLYYYKNRNNMQHQIEAINQVF